MTNHNTTYRNGKKARILIEDRPKTKFCVLSIDMKTGSIYHHLADGSYHIAGRDNETSPWDLMNYEETRTK